MGSHTARRTAATTAVMLAFAAATADVAAAQPDLRVTKVSYGLIGTTFGGTGDPEDRVVGAGATLRIAERTKNAGRAFARRSITRYFLEDQPLRALGRRSVEALAPGDSSGNRVDVVVPNVSPGTYRVLACADGSERIRERSERNNCRTASSRLTVRANERPVLSIAGGGKGAAIGAVMEGGDPAPLLPDLTLRDADDTQLTGATLSLIGAGGAGLYLMVYEREQEAEIISGTYDSGTGILTLRGTASVADYQAALRSIWFRVVGDAPPATQRVEVRVRDAVGAWSNRTRGTLSVTPVNDAPRVAVQEITDVTFPMSGGLVHDPDSGLAGATVKIISGFTSGDTLAFTNQRGISGTYDSGTGILTLTGNATVPDYRAALRSVGFTRAPGNRGGRTFEFQVRDQPGADSNPGFLNIEALP
jgi:hypothetical protein